MKKGNLAALICAALGNGIFGFSFMYSRLALDVTTPFVMLAYRFLTTFVLLILIALAVSRRPQSRADGEIPWTRFDLRGKNILPLIVLGCVQPVGYFLCESYGISLTNSTFAGVIIALIPIAGIVSGMITLREIPKLRQIAFSLLSIAGVIFMTLLQRAEGVVRPLGVVLLLGAVATGAYFNVLSRKLSAQFSALERTVVMMGVAAATFVVLALIQCRSDLSLLIAPLSQKEFIAAIAYLAVCSSVIAFLALNYANNVLPVVRTMAFANLTTLISLFAGVVFLHEPFSLWSIPASAMILVGIWGSQRG